MTKNPNTWCLKYNFSTDTETETNFDSGKAIFGTLPTDSGPTDLPTLTGSAGSPETNSNGFPVLPGVKPQGPNDLPTLSRTAVSAPSSTEASQTGPKSSVSPTFGIPPGGGFGLPPRALSPITKSASLPEPVAAHKLRARTFVPLNGSSVYALAPDGKHTFTSPSIYVVISSIKAMDSCGPLGNTYTSLTLSFEAGQLSTVDGVTQKTAVFNFADLPCPPQDYVVDNTVPNPVVGNTLLQSELAKSYHPRILVPSKSLQNLDPTWSSSSCIIVDVGNGYDPPRSLTPVTALDTPSTTNDPGQTDPETCLTCASPGLHTSVTALASVATIHPPIVLTSVSAIAPDPTSIIGQDPAATTSIGTEFSEEAHSSVGTLGSPTTVAVPDTQAPKSPVAHKPHSVLVDPSPALTVPNSSPNPPPSPQNPNPDPAQPDPAKPSPNPTPSAIVIGGQTLSNDGAPLHVNGNTEVPAPQLSPLTILEQTTRQPPQPAPVQPQPGSQNAHQPEAPMTIAGLTLTPAKPSPSPQQVGQSPENGLPAPQPSQNSPSNNGVRETVPTSPMVTSPQPVVIAGMTITPEALPIPAQISAQPGNTPIVAGGVTLTPVQNPQNGQNLPSIVLGSLAAATAHPAAAGVPEVQEGQTVMPISAQPLAQVSIGGTAIVLGPSNAVIGTTTISQGAAPIVVANTPLSLGSSALVVGSNTLPFQPQSKSPTTPIATVGGQPVIINPSGGLSIGGSAISAGFKATVDKTVISAPQSGGAVIGSSTIAPESPQSLRLATAPIFTVGDSTFMGNPSSINIGSTVLSQGAGVTIAHTPVSLGSNGLTIGSQTILRQSLNGIQPVMGSPSAFVVAGSTLFLGGPAINVKGTTVSFASNGIVIGGGTISTLPTIAGQQIQAASNGGIVIGSQTITPGAAATLSGSTVSVLPGGSGVVVNDQGTIPIRRIDGLQVHTAQGGSVVIDSQTLSRGAQATVSGTRVSILPNGQVSVAGITVPLASLSAPQGVQSGADHPSVYSIDGTALTEGSSPVTIHGTRLSLGSQGLHIGSSVVPYASLAQIPGIQAITGNPQIYSIDNTALIEGASAITVHGTRVSLGPSGALVVGSTTMQIPSYPTPSTASVAPYVIAGHTLTPGEAVTIAGTPISLGTNSELILGGTRTIDLALTAPSPSIFDVAGQVFTAAPGGFSIEGTSLYPGEATTIDGTPVSLNPVGIVIGSRTYSLPSSSVFAVDGQTLTANADGYSIDGQEIRFGAQATISGVPISLGQTGIIVVGTDTVPLASMTPISPVTKFTVDGQVFTKNSDGYSVDGVELQSNSAMTVSGHVFSDNGTAIVADSTTVPLSSTTTLSIPATTSAPTSSQGRTGIPHFVILWMTMVLVVFVGISIV